MSTHQDDSFVNSLSNFKNTIAKGTNLVLNYIGFDNLVSLYDQNKPVKQLAVLSNSIKLNADQVTPWTTNKFSSLTLF